jgi:DNA-binding SARP family transcriptional activator
MRCHVALGNRAAAINQYHALRRILNEELGLDPLPSSEIEILYHQLLIPS